MSSGTLALWISCGQLCVVGLAGWLASRKRPASPRTPDAPERVVLSPFGALFFEEFVPNSMTRTIGNK